MVFGVCRSVLGDGPDAEDAFQATFLILTQKAGSVRKAASLGCWLHGVARRAALKARARSATRQRHEARVPKRQESKADNLEWHEVRLLLHDELASLPARYREPLLLCYLEGQTQACAASRLGIGERTLRERLERGRALLRARLVRRGLGPAALLTAAAWPEATAMSCLPASLMSSTARAATAVLAGGGLASVVPAQVAALTEGMIRAMFVKKAALVALLFLLVIAGGSAGLALATNRLPTAQGGDAVEKPAREQRPQARAEAGERPSEDRSQPIRSLAGHNDRVTSVAYSPDGQRIATAAWDGTVRLWSSRTGQEERRLEVPRTRDYPTSHLAQVVFSPDCRFVLAAQQAAPNEPGVIVWDRGTGKKVRELPGGAGSVAVSPAGKLIACGG
jgi:RNA polymerase sigma factor (sigma-70 family)